MEAIKFLGHGAGLALLLASLLVILGVVAFFTSRSSKKEYTGRIIIPVLFIEIGVLFLILLLGFPQSKEAGVGPGVVPLLWITGIFAFSILLLIWVLTGHEDKDPEWGHLNVVLPYFVFTVLYLFLMPILGYSIATVLFLAGGMYFLSYRNWKVIISLTTGWLLFSYFAFYKLLYVPLPKGKLISWIFG